MTWIKGLQIVLGGVMQNLRWRMTTQDMTQIKSRRASSLVTLSLKDSVKVRRGIVDVKGVVSATPLFLFAGTRILEISTEKYLITKRNS